MFTYYLRDSLQTQQQERRKQEAKTKKQGGDTPYPGWDTLEQEQREEGKKEERCHHKGFFRAAVGHLGHWNVNQHCRGQYARRAAL